MQAKLVAVGCSLTPLEASEAGTTVGDLEREVKFWMAEDDGVEASRPSHCAACGVAAYRGDGRLRLHGHGSRQRTVWGPQATEATPGLWTVRMRRYRCTECRAARTVQPAGLATRLRYSLAAVALALTAWALWLLPAALVREQLSPWRIVGPSEPDRWRSLRRWAQRAAELFGLPASAMGASARARARRAAQLVRARGPTERPEVEQVVVGVRAA